jgi:hypothetical protein
MVGHHRELHAAVDRIINGGFPTGALVTAATCVEASSDGEEERHNAGTKYYYSMPSFPLASV